MNTSVTTASRSKHASRGSNIFKAFWGVLVRIAGRIQRMRRARATYMALRHLDDHMLKDIGLTRADVLDLENLGRDR